LDRLQKARIIVEAALDRKAEDVLILDVRELVSFADTFVIATGSSDRHVRSIVDGVEEALRTHGDKPLGIEGSEEGRWVLIDCDDAVCTSSCTTCASTTTSNASGAMRRSSASWAVPAGAKRPDATRDADRARRIWYR
jgi:ribosome silencing factor RsfS/YbeB/iojap